MYVGLARQTEGKGTGDNSLIFRLGVEECNCGKSLISGRRRGKGVQLRDTSPDCACMGQSDGKHEISIDLGGMGKETIVI